MEGSLLFRLQQQREAWVLDDLAKLEQVPAFWRERHTNHHEHGRYLAYFAGNLEALKVYEKYASRLASVEWEQLKPREIRALAKESAAEVQTALLTLDAKQPLGAVYMLAAVLCQVRGITEPKLKNDPKDNDYKGAINRAKCELFWRRAYRVKVQRLSEVEQIVGLNVCKVKGQPYSSNVAVIRRIEQNKANREALLNTYLQNEAGYSASLAELADKSTANKALRRGELMTRIKGAEHLSEQRGDTGLFFTLTLPSRFHPVTISGEANPKYEGSSPREGADWLGKTWARVRASLKRQGIAFYGVRVAEPHHDSCPHWHLLLWSEPANSKAIKDTIYEYWLQDAGEEQGAKKYRVKVETIKPRDQATGKGGAAAYLAKYVAKNIDDYKIDKHIDHVGGEQVEMFNDQQAGAVSSALRVEAWASHWSIRQFQTFGMPPVGVWRELRRVEHKKVLETNDKTLISAWVACQKIEDKAADFGAYSIVQGGAGATHRTCKIKIIKRNIQREGRYQDVLDTSPIGVRHGRNAVISNRCMWSEISKEEHDKTKRGKERGDSARASRLGLGLVSITVRQ